MLLVRNPMPNMRAMTKRRLALIRNLTLIYPNIKHIVKENRSDARSGEQFPGLGRF